MIAFPMTTHIEDLVLNISTALSVQTEDFMLESLPLGLLMFRIVFAVGVVCLIDETKVCGCLQMESATTAFYDAAVDVHSRM